MRLGRFERPSWILDHLSALSTWGSLPSVGEHGVPQGWGQATLSLISLTLSALVMMLACLWVGAGAGVLSYGTCDTRLRLSVNKGCAFLIGPVADPESLW